MSKDVKTMLTISLVSIFLTISIFIVSLHIQTKNRIDWITLLSSNWVSERWITLNTKTSKTSTPADWQKFMEYNIQDVELIDRLEDKMKLLELAITMSYDAKVNFEDVYSQVRMWDTMIYNYLSDRNCCSPS